MDYTIFYDKGTKLYKTVSFPCTSIKSFINSFPTQPCRTNKMIWLTEDKNRALSYGSELKIFKLKHDIELWNLMNPDLHDFFIEKIEDEEFTGLRNKILRIVSEGSSSIKLQSINLYGLLTGSGSYNVKKQLSILKTIHSKIDTLNDIFFDEKTIAQVMITPDNKTFEDAINEYIEIGNKLSEEEKNLTNQRLSIYGLDQLLLKLMCFNEKTTSMSKNIKGWYVPSGTQTVWTEFVDGKQVSDMGEIALFDCGDLIECSEETDKAMLRKKRKTKKRKSKKKRNKYTKHKNKKKKFKKRTNKK